MWQSRVETKHYSIAYFKHVTTFKELTSALLMCAHWKWNHASQASHWIISSRVSGLPQWQYTGMRQWRRKDFLIGGGGGGGGAQFQTIHRVVSNLYNNLCKLGGAHAPGSYAYVRMFASILRLTFFFVCGKGERTFISKHCTRWLRIFFRSNETSSILFPAAMWSAVAITTQSHSPRCCWTGTGNMRRPLLPCGIVAP